jgi:inner membrane protein
MDPLTQGLVGAALAQSAAKPNETRIAAAVGAGAGLLADADVLIRSSTDPLLTLEYHRHFTHSIFFVPLGALIAAVILWPFLRSRLAFSRLYLFAFLGYALSGVLDAFTSYGTHLFWPLSDERIAWNLIAIVDPAFTLVLLAAVLVALIKRRPHAAWVGLALAGLYLVGGWVQQHRAEGVARAIAAERQHAVERMLVKPTLGNILLWRTVYQSGNQFQVDAVRVGLGSTRVYPGGWLARVVPERDLTALPPDSNALRDAARFAAFADGYTVTHPERPDVLGDVRYANSPNGLIPLWGIALNPDRPQEHGRYLFFRDLGREQRARFWAMLRGHEVP